VRPMGGKEKGVTAIVTMLPLERKYIIWGLWGHLWPTNVSPQIVGRGVRRVRPKGQNIPMDMFIYTITIMNE